MPQVSRDKRFGSYPVGVLANEKNTIEIFFLHYVNRKQEKNGKDRFKELTG